MKQAPWTDTEVEALNRYQRSGRFHPFTCGLYEVTRRLHGRSGAQDCGALLRATNQGWVCTREGCPYTQDWAHEFMFENIKFPPSSFYPD